MIDFDRDGRDDLFFSQAGADVGGNGHVSVDSVTGAAYEQPLRLFVPGHDGDRDTVIGLAGGHHHVLVRDEPAFAIPRGEGSNR